MKFIDVFNGDADGICSLVQLRLSDPRESELVTGVKRDINLLQRLEVETGDQITVLDISMQKNHEDVLRLLCAGANIVYADHHNVGELIKHNNLKAHLNLSPSVCTSLIINKLLKGRYLLWAIVGGFGDNLIEVAQTLAFEAGLSEHETKQLESLGTYLNYNGYGASLDDLYFHPADLYHECVQFESPFDFIRNNHSVFERLESGFRSDIESATDVTPFHQSDKVAAFLLPDEKWARRVSGVYGNHLSNEYPERAHVILTPKSGNYVVSIRAPQNNLTGADLIAGQFATGGGRKGAAGINALKEFEIPRLIDLLEQQYG